MSQMPGGDKLGEVRTEFTADTSPLEAELRKAGASIESFAKSGVSSTNSLANAFGGLRASLRTMFGALGAAYTVLRGFITLADGMRKFADSARQVGEEMREFNRATGESIRSGIEQAKTVDDIDKAWQKQVESINEYVSSLERVRAEERTMELLQRKFWEFVYGQEDKFDRLQRSSLERRAQLERVYLEQRRRLEEEEAKRVAEQTAEIERKEQERKVEEIFDAFMSVRNAAKQAAREQMTEEQRLREELQDQLDVIEAIRNSGAYSRNRAILKQLDEYERTLRESTQRAIEQGAADALKRVNSEISAMLQRVQQEAAAIFDRQTVLLSDISILLRNIEGNTRRMRNN